ncbi:MAG: PAC2 family protein [Dehalococcoidia bacterium]|nr:PAC2 family protein [Dehalococcoidia bacterium]MDW8120322.1 PAC2 family protein [Chloroflexota bacterium]
MESLIVHTMPRLTHPVLITAFAGWPDAQEGATYAVRYLVRHLGATACASIDPEEFYDFQRVRPVVYLNERGERVIHWPSNDFYAWQGEGAPFGLLLFVGIEPHLRWKTFTRTILSLAHQVGVERVVMLGSLLDAVPHTREVRITGTANRPDLRRTLERLGVFSSRYQGPTGIGTALSEACTQAHLPFCSLWAHSPHYLQTSPNPKSSLALLSRLERLLGVTFPLGALRGMVVAFEAEVGKAIAGNAEMLAHLRRLEEAHDLLAERPPERQEELPAPEEMVRELEEFLRQQGRGNGGSELPGRGTPSGSGS